MKADSKKIETALKKIDGQSSFINDLKAPADGAKAAPLVTFGWGPDTPRHCKQPPSALAEIREKLEKHIKNGYLKQVQAPAGIRPVLKAWMELS